MLKDSVGDISSCQQMTVEHGGTEEHEPPSAGSAKRRMSAWVVILAVFAVVFYLVLRHYDNPVQASSSHHDPGAPVSVTAATAKRGDIGVYLTAIGTVTPVYTSTTPLVVITQMQPMTVIFTIAQDYLGQIQSALAQGIPLRVPAR
jgi:hypothetical protein